jgi:hypothetical protein
MQAFATDAFALSQEQLATPRSVAGDRKKLLLTQATNPKIKNPFVLMFFTMPKKNVQFVFVCSWTPKFLNLTKV